METSTKNRLVVGLLVFFIMIPSCLCFVIFRARTGTVEQQIAEISGSLSSEMDVAKTSAKMVADACLELIKTDQINQLMDCYGNEFFAATSKDEWKIILANIRDKLGILESYEMISWQARFPIAEATQGRRDTVIILVYKMQYSKHDDQEQITLFKKADSPSFKIIAHHFESSVLLRE